MCMDHHMTYNSAITFLCNLLLSSFSLISPQAFSEFFLLQSIPINLTIWKDEKEFFWQFDFLWSTMLFQMFLALDLLFLLFATFASLSSLDKSLSAIKLLVGKHFKSQSFSKLRSVARALSSPNWHSRPHCNLNADVHIIFKIFVDRLLVKTGDDIPWIEIIQFFSVCFFICEVWIQFGKISKSCFCKLTSMQFKNGKVK